MPRQVQAVEVNKFNAGLITDASPLTTPDNSSLDEDNMVLNIDGSRNRRLGMDYENDYAIVTTTIANNGTAFATNSYKWNNAGGDPDKSLLVVQLGNQIKLFHMDEGAVSAGFFYTYNFSSSLRATKFSFATVDGILVIVTGEKTIYFMEFTSPGTITLTTKRLLIRDLFGVQDTYLGVDITRGSDVTTRPTSLIDAHTYNLRNQSFGIPRLTPSEATSGGGGRFPPPSSDPEVSDPITVFKVVDGRYPSNADTVTEALYPDAENEDNRTIDRFFATNLSINPLGTTRAAQGYFIIDAIDRGASRISEYNKNMARYPELTVGISTLPTDSSASGPTAVTEFAGRVWYGGFAGAVTGGDDNSPKLSSYVMFSKVVDNILDAHVCYQEGDPTSKENPEIVATDGGFIRLNEAYDIKALINLGSTLMVVAANGVWRIVGSTDTGFTATSFIVEKISDRGCTSPSSIVRLDNTFMFWSDDAIYHVAPDQYGTMACNNLSFGRIQSFYDSITVSNKRIAFGSYDSYERKVRWVFNNNMNESVETRELVLDLQLQAYYLNTIKTPASVSVPRVLLTYTGLPYVVTTDEIPVFSDVTDVDVLTEDVVVSSTAISPTQQKETGYIVITASASNFSYTFSRYSDVGFRDWRSYNGVGVDAEAYVITSYLSGSDFQRDKKLDYITVHMRRTETGYDGDMVALNQSSCLLQARWGWSTSAASGKWGREFQAYRYRKQHIPVDSDDTYDTGFSVISSRNKLRGSGLVLSLKFRTEPDKDLHLYGWSMIFSVEGNV